MQEAFGDSELPDGELENSLVNTLVNQDYVPRDVFQAISTGSVFRASSSFNLVTKGDYMLAPFWFVYYTYNNQRYNFMMDGTGQHYSYSYPVDQEEVDFVNGKEKIKSRVSWLWLGFILVWYLLNFTSGMIYLAVWLVAKIVVSKKMNQAIQERLDESRSIRQAAAGNI